MNTIVNFEIAKLLKENGFDEPCSVAYKDNKIYLHRRKELTDWSLTKKWIPTLRKNSDMLNAIVPRYSAPTIADVIMWIYERYGIWIWVERYSIMFRPYAEELGDERFGKWEGHKYKTPTESYLEAIKYVLTVLI